MRDEELEQFKKGINLSEFAASKGYVIDHRESWGNKRKGDPTSLVMRHPNGDKIVIGRDEKSGDWIYYSIRDDRDNGTIIHFLQHRGGGSLGQVRKTLRPWLGSDRPVVPASSYVQTLVPTSKDRAGVIAEWERARVCTALPYLTSRGLGPDVLALPRFAGRVRVDRRNNALSRITIKTAFAVSRSKIEVLPASRRVGQRAFGTARRKRRTASSSWLKAPLMRIPTRYFIPMNYGPATCRREASLARNNAAISILNSLGCCAWLWKSYRPARSCFWPLIRMDLVKNSPKR